jgi:hypothetical protein
MRRLVAPSLLLLGGVFGGIVFARHCPSCIDPARVNKACEWTRDTAFPIDWNDPAHRQHLVSDAQLAEDLAIRNADAEFDKRFGIEHHGGLIDDGHFRDDCMARLVAVITTNHAVTMEQFALARGVRSRLFDTAVAVSFLPLFILSAVVMWGRLSRRLSTESASVRAVAIALTSLIAGFLGLQAGALWGAVWEATRVRNGHMSTFRSANYTRWTNDHVSVIFVALVVTFCIGSTSWRSPTFRKLARSAAMFSVTMLAAMFAEVFVLQPIGYIVLAAVVVLFYRSVLGVEHLDASHREADGVLLLSRS